MKLVPICNLRGDEVLAKHIIGFNEVELIAAGTVLKKEYLQKLIEIGIKAVYVEDDPNESDEDINRKHDIVIEYSKEVAKQVLETHIYKNSRELKRLTRIAQDIIDDVLNEKEIIEQITNVKEENADMYTHSINVCALASLLAAKAKFEKERIYDIAKGAILHDIGLRYITVPYENIDVRTLDKKQYIEYKKHVIYGYDAIKDEDWISEIQKQIILHHHERDDATGYPFKTTKNRVSREIKVVEICDAFDRMICGIGCVRATLQEAIEYISTYMGTKFDMELSEEFLELVSIYPEGTYVRLTSGEEGYIIRQNKGYKDRPIIKLIIDENGNKLPSPKVLDMCERLTVFIEKAIDSNIN